MLWGIIIISILQVRKIKAQGLDELPMVTLPQLLFLRKGSCGWDSQAITWWRPPGLYRHRMVDGDEGEEAKEA